MKTRQAGNPYMPYVPTRVGCRTIGLIGHKGMNNTPPWSHLLVRVQYRYDSTALLLVRVGSTLVAPATTHLHKHRMHELLDKKTLHKFKVKIACLLIISFDFERKYIFLHTV